MNFKFHHKSEEQTELEVTSFMNLMIVLVPVLLLSMTFTQITVLELSLPELTGGAINSEKPQSQLEIVVGDQGFRIYYPENVMLQEIPLVKLALEEGEPVVDSYDFNQLSRVMQAVKQQLPDKKDILVLSGADVSYQDLVSTMEAVKSFKTVVAASVVEVELFPEISLDDASKGRG